MLYCRLCTVKSCSILKIVKYTVNKLKNDKRQIYYFYNFWNEIKNVIRFFISLRKPCIFQQDWLKEVTIGKNGFRWMFIEMFNVLCITVYSRLTAACMCALNVRVHLCLLWVNMPGRGEVGQRGVRLGSHRLESNRSEWEELQEFGGSDLIPFKVTRILYYFI